MYFDYYLLGIILLPGIILSIIAEVKVANSFRKYAVIGAQLGQTASEVARTFLDNSGLHDVQIVRVHGELTDHYNHRRKTLALSDAVYDSTSIAALGVACHEVGHAIQFKQGYLPVKIRNVLAPICNYGSKVVWFILLMGFAFFYVLNTPVYFYLGIAIFALFVLMHLVTLPCEFNASKRATLLLEKSGYLSSSELVGAKKVLSAAALTYVAALIVSILELLRLVLLVMSRTRKRD